MNIADKKVMSKWHQREDIASLDWHKSQYQIEAEEREVRKRKREAIWGMVFWVLTVCVIWWTWS